MNGAKNKILKSRWRVFKTKVSKNRQTWIIVTLPKKSFVKRSFEKLSNLIIREVVERNSFAIGRNIEKLENSVSKKWGHPNKNNKIVTSRCFF